MSNYTLFTEILLDIVNYFWAPFCRTASNHNLLDFSLQSSWDYRHETLRSSLVCIYLITGEVEEIFMYWFSYLFNQLTFTTQVDMEARPRSASHCDFFFFFTNFPLKFNCLFIGDVCFEYVSLDYMSLCVILLITDKHFFLSFETWLHNFNF
jgi:hypothetical protein